MTEKELNRVIATNIVRLLDQKNRTQQELAEYVGVSQAAVSSWCSGQKTPRMNKIDKICEFLGVQRSAILGTGIIAPHHHTNPETEQIAQTIYDDPDLHALFDAARGSNPDNLKLAAEMLKRMKETNNDG
jgi:transcriptional regulator with XRE-family HTH domain